MPIKHKGFFYENLDKVIEAYEHKLDIAIYTWDKPFCTKRTAALMILSILFVLLVLTIIGTLLVDTGVIKVGPAPLNVTVNATNST